MTTAGPQQHAMAEQPITAHPVSGRSQSSDGPATLYILPRHATSWARMREQAAVLQSAPGVHPVVLLANRFMADRAQQCSELGLETLDLHREIERRVSTSAPILHRLAARFDCWLTRHDVIANRLPLCFLRMAQTRHRLRVEYDLFRSLFENELPAAVLVPGDRELSPVPAVLRAGLDLGIPTIIGFSGVPYADGGVEHARAAADRFKLSLHTLPPLLNLYAGWRYPGQVRRTRNGKRLFSPGWLILTLAARGMLSANPWLQGAGNCAYLIQHNRVFMSYFTKHGVPAEKSILIGDVSLDPLHAACQSRATIRKALAAQLGLTAEDKLVVVSVPNDYEHDVCDLPTHLARMDRFLGQLAKPRLKVMLSLHPKARREHYQDLATRYGFVFAEQALTECLPAADLFVCSCSSTILFAKLAAVRSINLDYLGLRDEDFEDVPGLENVETPEAFSTVLDRIVEEPSNTTPEDVVSHAAALAGETLFDGRATQRFVAFATSLAAQNRNRALDPA